MKKITLLFLMTWISYSIVFAQTVKSVDPSLFLEDGTNVTIKTVTCTLSDGTSTTCYEILSTSSPTDHTMGPWCPDNISDGPEAGGIWLEGGEVFDVDGAFIENMATFYNDDRWLMYDSNGDIFTTDTEEDCGNAANPNVGAEYENFCVECLPSYVTDITQTYLIPTTPVAVNASISFGGMGPPRQNAGPSVRGVAFNGVRFDAAAPTDAILGAYTLAPFDDAGGHINLAAGYHYHAATGVSTEIAQSDGHAPMIGYALDGHALYAQLDENGNEPTDLDACRGHSDDIRGYHYHVDAPGSNNFINCLNGAYVTASGAEVTDNADDTDNTEGTEDTGGTDTGNNNNTGDANITESFFNSSSLVSITTVNCTLENGSNTTCYELVFNSNPVENGPYCPNTIDEIGGVGIYDGDTNPGFQVLKRSLWEAMEADGFDIVDEDGNITVVNPGGGGPPTDAGGDDATGGITSACLEAAPDDDLSLTFLIPVTPEFLSTPDVMQSVENIGVSIDGIPITGDPPSVTMSSGNMPGGGGAIPSIDPCGGHMDPSGYYHLHFVAEEMNNILDAFGITEVSCTNYTQNETALIGFAKDGFPIYASRDSDGTLPTDLDECNGHFGPTPEFPDGIYHYHASSTDAPNVPPCLVGASVGNSLSIAAGAQETIGDNTGEGNPIEDGTSACADNGGDADNDGICANDDCDDTDANVGAKQTAGTTCDDGITTTENDVILADGCSCAGTSIDPCASRGGDADNDGICADDDCDDMDSNIGITQGIGAACDDGDATTENDMIQADGCSCAGTTIANTACTAPSDAVVTAVGNRSIRITWSPVSNANNYTIQIRFQGMDRWLVTSTIRSTRVQVHGPQRAYEFRVRSNCSEASSEYSTIQTFSIPSSGLTDGIASSRSKEKLEEILIQNEASLYPNPVKTNLTLFYSTVFEQTDFMVYDVTGKVVSKQKLSVGTDNYSVSVDHLDAGYYIGIVRENGRVSYTEKFVKE